MTMAIGYTLGGWFVHSAQWTFKHTTHRGITILVPYGSRLLAGEPQTATELEMKTTCQVLSAERHRASGFAGMKRMGASAGSQVIIRRGRFQEAQGVAEGARAFADCRSRLPADTFCALRVVEEPDVQGGDVDSCKHRGGTEADNIPETDFVPLISQTITVRKMLYGLLRRLSIPEPDSTPKKTTRKAPKDSAGPQESAGP